MSRPTRPAPPRAVLLLVALCCAAFLAGPASSADDEGWTVLVGKGRELDAWKKPTGKWSVAGDAHLDPKNPRLLAADPGEGTIVNGPDGRTTNLVSTRRFGPVEVHLEFLVPKGSNSGIKLEGLYEVQIADSWGVEKPTASHSGGIYPRAELLPRYHHIDDGYPPRANASRPPGVWQTLDVVFVPPRFDAEGKKVADARFVRVVLNGKTVQEDVALGAPTGHAWHNREIAEGPILLQADHGPVAFRDVRVRPWRE